MQKMDKLETVYRNKVLIVNVEELNREKQDILLKKSYNGENSIMDIKIRMGK